MKNLFFSVLLNSYFKVVGNTGIDNSVIWISHHIHPVLFHNYKVVDCFGLNGRPRNDNYNELRNRSTITDSYRISDILKIGRYRAMATVRTIAPTVIIIRGSSSVIRVVMAASTFRS